MPSQAEQLRDFSLVGPSSESDIDPEAQSSSVRSTRYALFTTIGVGMLLGVAYCIIGSNAAAPASSSVNAKPEVVGLSKVAAPSPSLVPKVPLAPRHVPAAEPDRYLSPSPSPSPTAAITTSQVPTPSPSPTVNPPTVAPNPCANPTPAPSQVNPCMTATTKPVNPCAPVVPVSTVTTTPKPMIPWNWNVPVLAKK